MACTAVMSLAAMMMRKGYLSLVSVSVLGAAAHNLVQLAVAGAIIGSAALLRGYFPLLLLLAVPTGVFTGLAAYYLEGVTGRAAGHAGGPGVDGQLISPQLLPRRAALLRQAGIPHSVILSDLQEEERPESLNPAETALYLALQKARRVSAGLQEGLVLGADTVVCHRGEILANPRTGAKPAGCCAA